jgi:hypothetical protein
MLPKVWKRFAVETVWMGLDDEDVEGEEIGSVEEEEGDGEDTGSVEEVEERCLVVGVLGGGKRVSESRSIDLLTCLAVYFTFPFIHKVAVSIEEYVSGWGEEVCLVRHALTTVLKLSERIEFLLINYEILSKKVPPSSFR